ncbi:MAG: ATP-dependent helicase [Candidatus Dormiibacterota bacterium]
MFEWLDDLTDAQRSAVTHDGGPLRILAGAGTGKTTTLSARVAWLLATGAPPERLLLLTFTRRAARQMLARTSSRMTAAGFDRASGSPAGRVTGGTFHAIAHRTLRRYAATLGIPEGFSVLDAADAADVIDMVRDQQGHAASTRRRFPRKALLVDLYSAAVNTGRPLSSVVPEMAPWAEDCVEAIAEICRGYVRRKRSAGLVDLDDLLLFWRAAVQDDRLGPRLAGALDHVLVDEYQDVNELQVDILTGLRRADPRITVVGDDAQALYSFRAAEPRHILEFDRVFPGSTTVILETNYRSSQQILDVANAVGADATIGFSAVLHAARTAPGAGPQLVRCADEDTQTDAVCDRILAHREAGVALHDQAVLVRAAHHSALLELELGARRIPYVKYGGLRFVEAAHVKDMLAAFRLADNPNDVVAWFRLLQLLVGVGPATAHRVVAALGLLNSADTPPDVDVLASWPHASSHLPEEARTAAGDLVSALMTRPRELVPTHAERLRVAVAPLVEAAYPGAPARLADLDTLVAASAKVARLSDVAVDHVLEPPRSTANLAGPPLIDEDWLVISTVHSAKGLEWDVVHVLHVTDGNIPSDMALGSPAGLEEERRVFYVALTRARNALHLYVPERYHHHPNGRDDRHSLARPSRFLSERVRSRCDELTEQSHRSDSFPTIPNVDASEQVGVALEGLWS